MSPNDPLRAYVDRVCAHLFWPPYRARVRRELTDHLLSRAEALQNERGFSEAEAAAQAVASLGDPDELARALRRARLPPQCIPWLVATAAVWAAIAACAVFLLLQLRA